MENEVDKLLVERFGLAQFRAGQREAVEAVLAGRDAIVVMPTGSGKSLCYQLTALALPGTTLVISPLIALMKDQLDALTAKGVPATVVNSTVPKTEMAKRLAAMRKGEYKLVYVAPERFRSEDFTDALGGTAVSMVAIDEAHCISQWGHDFRPDYLEVGRIVSAMDGVRIMALTATATPSVRQDIAAQLGLGAARPDPFVEVLGFSRPNLHLSVAKCPRDEDKERALLSLIKECRTGIVYVSTRRHAQSVYEMLQRRFGETEGVAVLMYHAALSESKRSEVQREFMTAEHPVVVATTAFGMGIDRADIRFVAHWDVPGGIEQYYQEIGRAGRDGQPARCVLLFQYRDIKVQEWFLEGANPDAETALRVWRHFRSFGDQEVEFDGDVFAKALCIRNAIKVNTVVNVLVQKGCLTRVRQGYAQTFRVNPGTSDAEVASIFTDRRSKEIRDRERLDAMRRFAYATRCRHRYILEYFGDQSSARACGGCDNCDARHGIARRNPAVGEGSVSMAGRGEKGEKGEASRCGNRPPLDMVDFPSSVIGGYSLSASDDEGKANEELNAAIVEYLRVKDEARRLAERLSAMKANIDRLRSANIDRLRFANSDRLRSANIDRLRSENSDRLRSANIDRLRSENSDRLRSANIDRLRSENSDRLRSANIDRLRSENSEPLRFANQS